MKRIIYLLALAAVVLSVYSCSDNGIRPKGPLVRLERPITGPFDTISVESGLKVYVTTDSIDRVEVETNENLQSYIQTDIRSRNLVVSMKDSTKIIGTPTINVYVSAASLSAINCSEGSEAILQKIATADSLSTLIFGGSSLEGEIMVNNYTCDVHAGSTHNVTGRVGNCVARLSGGSGAMQFALVVDSLAADLSQGSQMQITVNNSFNIMASGGSKLEYQGAGSGTFDAIQGSTVERK